MKRYRVIASFRCEFEVEAEGEEDAIEGAQRRAEESLSFWSSSANPYDMFEWKVKEVSGEHGSPIQG